MPEKTRNCWQNVWALYHHVDLACWIRDDVNLTTLSLSLSLSLSLFCQTNQDWDIILISRWNFPWFYLTLWPRILLISHLLQFNTVTGKVSTLTLKQTLNTFHYFQDQLFWLKHNKKPPQLIPSASSNSTLRSVLLVPKLSLKSNKFMVGKRLPVLFKELISVTLFYIVWTSHSLPLSRPLLSLLLLSFMP